MNLDETLKLAGIISAIIAVLITYFNNQYKNYESLQDEYLNKLLTNYVKLYRDNKSINTVKYIKKNYGIDNIYIPKYIFYLVEKNDKENLHKVLINDYIKYHLTFENVIYKTLDTIFGIIRFLFMVAYLVASFYIAYVICLVVFGSIFQGSAFEKDNMIIISNLQIPVYVSVMANIITNIILLFIMLLMMKLIAKNRDDDYSLNLKSIKKKIKKKTKRYTKNIDKYFI